MLGLIALFLLPPFEETRPVETRLIQAFPFAEMTSPRDCKRAVILIQGLRQHLRDSKKVPQALVREWQKPGSALVNALSKDADVYAFAYGQNVSVDEIAVSEGLRDGVNGIKKAGYTEIILVGFSAGGLIARQFVEDNPRSGVTKVVQICTPNTGSELTKIPFAIPKAQKSFVNSMAPAARERCLRMRDDKKIPDQIEFVCVVGKVKGLNGDGVVSVPSQWPRDLQEQGIPAVVVPTTHLNVMKGHDSVGRIAEVVRAPQPRWTEIRIVETRKEITSSDGADR